MGVTQRNRQQVYNAITKIIGTRKVTRMEILPALQKQFPFVTDNALYQILGTLETDKVLCIAGYEKKGGKPIRIYKVRDKPPPLSKQTWITPLFTSIAPL